MRYAILLFSILLTSSIVLPLLNEPEERPTQTVEGGKILTENIGEHQEKSLEGQDRLQEKLSELEPEPKSQDIFPKSMTVFNVHETNTVSIREQPSSDSKNLGIVYGDLMHVDVIDHLDNGYSKISTWDYKSMKQVDGFVPTKYIKEVSLSGKYEITVDLSEQRVCVYENDAVFKTFVCSTGLDENYSFTPKGLYRIGARGHSFFSPKYGQGAYHWVRFNNNYLFHSVPFDENEEIIEEEVAKLGSKASHGCVRLSLEDAKWFYENIPEGTPVLIKD